MTPAGVPVSAMRVSYWASSDRSDLSSTNLTTLYEAIMAQVRALGGGQYGS